MEILEDELFYLNPFVAEMYSNCGGSSSEASAAFDQLKLSSASLINSWNGEEMSMIPSSSSTIAAAVEAPQLISFEKETFSPFSPTNNTDYGTDCNNQTPQIISFCAKEDDDNGKRERASTGTRTPLQAQDHLMAERKRREDLRQLFIALSKVVPGLKKLDKASLLEDAIKHLKSLQERVDALEKEETMRRAASMSNSGCESVPAEMSVRVRERHVLLKMCCKKQMALMSIIPSQMESLHLNVLDIRIMPFGEAALDVTILAEMKSEFSGTVKDIVDHLQGVIGQI